MRLRDLIWVNNLQSDLSVRILCLNTVILKMCDRIVISFSMTFLACTFQYSFDSYFVIAHLETFEQSFAFPFLILFLTITYGAQSTKRALMQFADNAGPDQPAHSPSLSAYRINGYCSTCRRTKNVQIRLHGCARPSGPSLLHVA